MLRLLKNRKVVVSILLKKKERPPILVDQKKSSEPRPYDNPSCLQFRVAVCVIDVVHLNGDLLPCESKGS
jgi:hypothetical protein